MDNISVYLIPKSSGVCGKGISLWHGNVTDSWMINSTIIITNFNFNAKHSGCLSYGDGSFGVYLNFIMKEISYTTTIRVCQSSINGVTLYHDHIIYTFMENCNVTHFWFENCTFDGMQRRPEWSKNKFTQTSMIQMKVPHANVVVRFVQCIF